MRSENSINVDVIFPVMHGTFAEDGTIQGLLELADIAYVGAGVLGSAAGMDKDVMKRLFRDAGLPIVKHVTFLRPQFQRDPKGVRKQIERELRYPVFVKPANLGSSVGVTKAHDDDELQDALTEALRYDEYVIVEEAIAGREIEVAVLGNAAPRASVPGEIVPSHEFYDFEDKYVDGAAGLRAPAPLSDEDTERVRQLAVDAYRALRVDGMARADFFYEEGGRGFLVNELNTIPGFTPISMYPKLWEASGLPYDELVDELVRLALERHERRSRFDTKR